MSGQDESNPALWLATRAGKMVLSCPLGTTCCVPQEKFPRKPYSKSIIDEACLVKMAGLFFFYKFMDLDSISVYKHVKMNLANNQPSWPNKLGQKPIYLDHLVEQRPINMDYWSSVRSRWLDIGQVLFLRVKVHKLAKKERGQYPTILTEQAWSIKDLLYGFWGNFSCRTRRAVPSRQDSSILPAWVANHSVGFDSSCPLTELAI